MRWRIATILVLFALPIMAFVAIGAVAIWQHGTGAWVWWMFPICWAMAFLLARFWRRSLSPPPSAFASVPYWTERDRAAWRIVESQQRAVESLTREQLAETAIYLQGAQELALQLAHHYRPQAQHPINGLTIAEILAAAQLALEDSAQWVDQYIPGSHLMTIGQWKTLSRVPAWLRVFSNATWAVRIVLQPTYLAQFLTTRWATQSATHQVRENVLAWFYVAFLRHVGFYLIEMNSGRLQGGATHYREALRGLNHRSSSSQGTPTDEPVASRDVTIALVGQVNVGKSSLINAFLGEHQAVVDVLPATADVTRYTLQLRGTGETLTLLDTPGYGSTGATDAQRRQTHTAIRQADLLLLVMNATNPARQADLDVVRELTQWCDEQEHRKRAAILGVLTHADALSPVMEWAPPYDWTRPTRDKEHSMAAAAQVVQREFGEPLAGVVPVCSDVKRDRSYGVHEWLLPTLLVLLDDARACAVLRNLHDELSDGQFERLFRQLGNAGWGILKTCFASPGQE